MSTTPNYAGNFLSNPPPFLSNYAAIASPWGTMLKPGGRVAAYVRSTGAQDGEDHFAASGLLVSSLNEACKRCRSGMGDIIYVLPGHTENLAVADAVPDLVAGTQIIGCGRPGSSNAPTLVWTAAAATLLLNVADVTLAGFNLNFTGANTIAAPIIVTGTGCSIVGCKMDLGSGASNDAQTPITLSTGAHDCLIAGNHMAPSGAQNANVIIIHVAAAVARAQILGNYISTTLTATTNGVIHVGAAATDLNIGRNIIANYVADGIGIEVADTFAATGIIWENYIGLLGTTATAASKGVHFTGTTEASILLMENYCSDVTAQTGIVCGTVAS